MLHTSAWPTFATGALPGRHGVYYPYQPKPGHQQAQLLAPDQYGMPTFWEIADRARRTLVYDLPETFPSAGFEGRGIFDWGTWAWYGTPASQPAALLGELKSRFGGYPLGMEAKRLGLGRPDPRTLTERLLTSVAYKQTTARWLLESAPWDLAVVGFCELHPAGHYLWPAGAAPHDHGDAPEFAALRSVYGAIDAALGALRAALPEGATMLVVSGDGLRPNHCGWHLLPAVMERLGYAPGAGRRVWAGGGSLLGRLKQAVSPEMRRRIADRLPWWLRDRIGAQIQAAQIDWSRTRAFTLPTDLEGCIRINLEGREPQGIVPPGAEYRALCAELAEQLGELVNPATGDRAVERVWLCDEVFPGDQRDHLPDLVVTWSGEAPIAALDIAALRPGRGGEPRPPHRHPFDHGFPARGRAGHRRRGRRARPPGRRGADRARPARPRGARPGHGWPGARRVPRPARAEPRSAGIAWTCSTSWRSGSTCSPSASGSARCSSPIPTAPASSRELFERRLKGDRLVRPGRAVADRHLHAPLPRDHAWADLFSADVHREHAGAGCCGSRSPSC